MKISLALAVVSIASAHVELLAPRNVMVEEAPPMYRAMCPTCCTETLRQTTIKETYYSTKIETVYKTSTEHDVSTQIQYTTQFVTKTDVSTFTTSYPVTVTSLINCTKKKPASSSHVIKRFGQTYPHVESPLECETVTRTDWKTTTSTDHVVSTITILAPTVSVVPTTLTDIETVTQAHNQSVTIWVPTTYTATVTRTSKYPFTVTSEHDVTVITTASTTETIVTTLTTSYPVVTHDTITQKPSTVLLPGTTVTAPASSTKIFVCPTPTGSYAPLDPNSNRTFGCSPGTVCAPQMPDGCNVWPGPPSDDFVCRASDCIPALPFTLTHWRDNETAYYPPSYGYFNLKPTAFGLPYDIFQDRSRQTRGERSVVKRGITPPQCFDECNNAYVTAEADGKTDELCRDGSSFRVGFDLCTTCIQIHSDPLTKTVDDYVGPAFAQFMNFCKGRRSEPRTSPAGASPAAITQPEQESRVSSRLLQTSTQMGASSGGFEPAPAESTTPDIVPGLQNTPSVSAGHRTAPLTSVGTMPSSDSSLESEPGGATTPDIGGASSIDFPNTTSGSGAVPSTDTSAQSTSDTTALDARPTHTRSLVGVVDITSGNVSKTASATTNGVASSVVGSGSGSAATLAASDGTPLVVANGVTSQYDLGGAAQTLIVAILVFVLV